MNQDITFVYKYSAKENREIEEIRKKYLPREESKMDELKRLDNTVQNSGIMESLCVGIGGALVFGFGLCLAMQVLGSGVFFVILGVLVGIIGVGAMLAAYPIYRKVFDRTKKELTPRILALTSELCGKNNQV